MVALGGASVSYERGTTLLAVELLVRRRPTVLRLPCRVSNSSTLEIRQLLSHIRQLWKQESVNFGAGKGLASLERE